MEDDSATVRRVIEEALAEDLGPGDVTSEAVVPESARFRGEITARQALVVAGIEIALQVFQTLAAKANAEVMAEPLVADGAKVAAGAVLATVRGPARVLLGAERTALNLLQHLSGIATASRACADRIAGTGAGLLDTRKTLPGLRRLAKYATRVGGATNHRMGLYDAVLIKDNHIAVAGSITEAVARARAKGLAPIEVECDSLDQVEEAVRAGAETVLLDNMEPGTLREAVRRIAGRARTEASGGITLETIRAVAETGVDFVSTSHITLSAPAVDIGLDWKSLG